MGDLKTAALDPAHDRHPCLGFQRQSTATHRTGNRQTGVTGNRHNVRARDIVLWLIQVQLV